MALAADVDPKCNLCSGTGENKTGITMKVNNDLCPRCGGYGTVPFSSNLSAKFANSRSLTDQDNEYIDCNGRC